MSRDLTQLELRVRLDSNNDGISDRLEAYRQPKNGTTPAGGLLPLDTDWNGIPDIADISQTGIWDSDANGINDASDALFPGVAD